MTKVCQLKWRDKYDKWWFLVKITSDENIPRQFWCSYVPSQYLKTFWLLSNRFLWHSPEKPFHTKCSRHIEFQIYTCKINITSLRASDLIVYDLIINLCFQYRHVGTVFVGCFRKPFWWHVTQTIIIFLIFGHHWLLATRNTSIPINQDLNRLQITYAEWRAQTSV